MQSTQPALVSIPGVWILHTHTHGHVVEDPLSTARVHRLYPPEYTVMIMARDSREMEI